jgi:hypothetical protein
MHYPNTQSDNNWVSDYEYVYLRFKRSKCLKGCFYLGITLIKKYYKGSHESPKPNYYQIGCLDNAFDLVNRIWRYSENQINTVVFMICLKKELLRAHIPKPADESPLEHGCKDGKFGLEPILFEGQMSSDFLQDLVYFVSP